MATLCLQSASRHCSRSTLRRTASGPASTVTPNNTTFTCSPQDELEWFKQRGCTEIKVEAEPGDLVLWDSRTIHHVARNESEQIRSVIYVCMTPRDLPSQEDLDLETNIFKKFEAATHWPHCNIWRQGKAQMNGERDPSERDEPLEKPVVTDQILRLAGIKPYHE